MDRATKRAASHSGSVVRRFLLHAGGRTARRRGERENVENGMDHSPELEFDARLGRAWSDDHRYLLNVAFRVLGSISEAEDAVQEAFARLVDQNLDEIDDVRGWLTVVVSRLCFDRLRSADRQRRSATALHDLELPPAHDMDPADRITLDDEVRLALHIVMTQLTPAERVAFVLHDVFSYSFDAISEILGRSPAACRQLASRARRTINPGDAGRSTVDAIDAHRVAEQFITACSTGDFEGLLALMDPDCSTHVDIGVAVGDVVDLPGYGQRRHQPPTGREGIARIALRYNGPGSSVTLLSLPVIGKPTIVGVHDGRVVMFTTVTVHEGRITHADTVLDPSKLADLNLVLDT
jgi:RNA polymerase sigma-70 factor, ECF subfamily